MLWDWLVLYGVADEGMEVIVSYDMVSVPTTSLVLEDTLTILVLTELLDLLEVVMEVEVKVIVDLEGEDVEEGEE